MEEDYWTLDEWKILSKRPKNKLCEVTPAEKTDEPCKKRKQTPKEKRCASWSRHSGLSHQVQPPPPNRAANTSTSSSDAGIASPPKRLKTRGHEVRPIPDLVGALTRTGVSAVQALRIVAAYGHK
ncbi:hypothetical protein GWK47_035021 [Chionoecetes opilio]|uniref:Uncharacterized protein n=1 Tax=Chionoecetes opilio TaxID=41210 RepID=A0A8J4YUC8_CHIOP|nr:hypothetical protein GWK47_035021 [Chionoecetes opilio]